MRFARCALCLEFTLSALIALGARPTSAAPGRFGVGATIAVEGIPYGAALGRPTGLSAAFRVHRWLALDAAIGLGQSYYHVEALLTLPAGSHLAPYVGAGGYLDYGGTGVRMPLGLAVDFDDRRYQLFIEASVRTPTSGQMPTGMGIGAVAGARYYF